MRVLLFRWLCDSGGVSTSMLLLGRELERRGVACEYWFCKPSSRVAEFEAAGPTTVAPLGYLAPRLGRGEFDVINVGNSDPGAQLIATLARPARVVVTSHGGLSDLWNSTNCFAYTAVSAAMARVNQPYTDLQIDVTRNGLDLDRYAPPENRNAGPPIVAFVGRTFAREKDFPRFTRVAQHLVNRGVRIWVADPHESTWDDFHGLPVAKVEVERWGRVVPAAMPDFYRDIARSAGALLVTSRTEGFGYVAIEAAASGAITVAPDLLGLRESVLPGKTGVLFDPDMDDESVAQLVLTAMAQQSPPHIVADATKGFGASFMADEYLAVFSRSGQRTALHTPPTAEPGLAVLREHLGRQGAWRADASLSAAVSLAARGYPARAVTAIGQALDASPRRVFRARGLRQLLAAAGWIVRRPDRLYRQWRLRDAAFAVPPVGH